MKTDTILFYVNPSIETRIKNAKTIDLMEGGKEQAQDVPNSEINPCDRAARRATQTAAAEMYPYKQTLRVLKKW